MNPLRVAHDVINYIKNGEEKIRKFTYRDVKFDPGGWADAKLFLPADFDLVYLKTEEKTYSGWFTGISWDGLKHKLDSEVLYWKRQD